jgi:hypothetical protein
VFLVAQASAYEFRPAVAPRKTGGLNLISENILYNIPYFVIPSEARNLSLI